MRVQLAPFRLQDFDTLIGWIDTPEKLVQWSGARRFTFPLSSAQLSVHMYDTLGVEPRSRIYTAIDDNGRVIGHAEFLGISPRDAVATLCGIMIAPEARRMGYCLPLVQSMLELGFGKLNLRRIELNVYDTNPAAIACYERAGFVREGLLRKSVLLGDRFWNTIVMAILREEWVP